MIIAVSSCRGAPGVSTLAVLLGELWPGEEPSWIIEADPAGGILAARWLHLVRLAWEPGLLDLASSRSVVDTALLERFSQPLTARVRVIPAPPTAEQVHAALINLGADGATEIARASALVVVDCGRIAPGSPALPLARAAAVSVLVFRPTLEESQAVVRACDELRAEQAHVVLVAVGDGPYLPDDIAREAGGVPCIVISDDVRSAQVLRERGPLSRAFRRSPLARSVRSAAEALAALVLPPASAVIDLTDNRSDEVHSGSGGHGGEP